MGLTSEQVRTLIVIERCTASVSVFATLLLVTTFIFIKPFRTLSNTLIFYASFANIFANVAALIGGSALSNVNGGLCQFQGFLLEMFMQSDPMWSCAMAVNVYLVFFRRYDAARIKRLYWIYGVICYGLPFIPAMFCLFYKTEKKGKIYGNATLWCWIDNNWAPVRIYSYYAPIWVAILTTFVIYLRVGVEIFQKRAQLREAVNANGDYADGTTLDSSTDSKSSPISFTGIRTTEIHVTTDQWSNPATKSPSQAHAQGHGQKDQYSITISSNAARPPMPASPSGVNTRKPNTPKRSGYSVDRIKWAYTKCAMLFAISILITWVPASVNRVHGLRYPKNPSFALNVGSALVLPLQGFWNAIIYFLTSLGICKSVWADWMARRNSRKRSNVQQIVHLGPNYGGRLKAGGVKANQPLGLRMKDSESMIELSGGRSDRSLDGSV